MEINWTVVTYFVVGYFALAGFSRGWWKEAVTTSALAGFILLLQNPDWAQRLVDLINSLLATVWNYIPTSITPVVNNGLETVFAVSTSGSSPIQIDASDPGTWLTILGLVVGASILFGRVTLGNQPTAPGKVLGVALGGLNGFLILSLVREYLDGRALPGQTGPESEITLAGTSSFGPAASSLSIQFTGLSGVTILDSFIPWLAMGIGLLFLVSVLKTRLGVATSADGRKLQTKVPPYYKPLPPKKVKPPEATTIRIMP
jgi:hypothetical protein